jgi:hypothetical protein
MSVAVPILPPPIPSMPHIIRLRGPWDYEVLSQIAGPPVAEPTGRLQMPSDWSATFDADFRGSVRYRRFFNWTAPVDNGLKVTLAFDGVAETAQATLNGRSLGSIGPGHAWFAVAHLLQPRNELAVDVESPEDATIPGGLTGEVRLEIE